MLLVNGDPVRSVDPCDRGLQYGDGVFETIAVRGGKPELWHAHLKRLITGCKALDIPPPDPEQLAREIARVTADQTRCVAKLVITRGPGGRGYRKPDQAKPTRLVMSSPFPDYPSKWAKSGVAVRLCRTPLGLNPVLAGLKHLNRLEQVMARNEWQSPEIAEGLMSDSEGFLVEGTMSNLFLIVDDTLVTPRLDRCGVEGIMRNKVLEVATSLGIPTREERVTLSTLQQGEGAFLTNSLLRMWPILTLEDRECPQTAITATLRRALDKVLEE
ncbi:aminodeoxychorismate lyase [Thiohalomonas denitrificans]|uniref:Aminodeoxychorismate lyase n=1 Tax=Thiohalomonas denitrificans TaxID=415747 RepID=A0A1G5QB83_9GAMM|nr:aminodeoxychorismate lyase [Thiohalomonas denitrificans]SCZ58957.1 4-amino-4-deoxychorismate lyase [Thiohalomonas denitrificans]